MTGNEFPAGAEALTAYGRVQDRMLSLTARLQHARAQADPRELATIIASVAARPPQTGAP
jgi:hypothetical protein